MKRASVAAVLLALVAADCTPASAPGGGDPGGGDGTPAPSPLPAIVQAPEPKVAATSRPGWGALVVAGDGERAYVVESRRDVEPGPYGMPWRTRFRLAAYDAGVEVWSLPAEPDDLIGDVVVHPSGEVTVSIERFVPASDAYELVRLAPSGAELARASLASPATIPAGDYAATDPQPLFAMKSDPGDATTAGWVRLLADGEGLVVAFLSHVPAAQHTPWNRLALGLTALDWQDDGWVERWARVVEGRHLAYPAAWAYDELRWMEQAVRPFLARDETSGDLLVGRAWNSSRCQANVSTFAEFPASECRTGAASTSEVDLLPLAVTRFGRDGTRVGTCILRPDLDAAEQLAFALAARGGELAVVGSVVRTLPDGNTKRTYPDANGFVDYDGFVAVYDDQGVLRRSHDYNLGRGDILAGMRWTDRGIVAVGAAGWDRWQGGMSISRGSSPLFVWLSPDGADAGERVVPLDDGTRHWNLHDLVLLENSVVGYGFADAPMTHSADAGGTEARTFGSLQARLDADAAL